MNINVITVDPSDDEKFPAWYDTFTAGLAAGRPDPPLYSYEESRVELRRPTPYAEHRAFLASHPDGPIGAARVSLPAHDNPRLLTFTIAVRPEFRGRGAGSALYRRLREIAEAERRTSLLTEIDLPLTGNATPGTGFASRHGFTRRNTETRRVLRLPLHEGAGAERAAVPGYTITGWVGPCPEEFAGQYAALRGRLMTEAPTGDLDYEQERWGVDRLRDEEARFAEQGRTSCVTVAIAPDGRLAGHTVIVASRESGWASQWDTLVLPTHRGRRIGLALKVANLRALRAACPHVSRVDTCNAEDNRPMIAINERLGFRPVERCEGWQLDLGVPAL
ncbi:GNAT family N-acetyltransferase [Sphaerisporangium sp. B11E5]|uniref:GNAT family N-acetyltransferase n=1 Tax=Sphaerisporangium sp. B11E5 TaxID=3153563 RepID=UPI00325C4A29